MVTKIEKFSFIIFLSSLLLSCRGGHFQSQEFFSRAERLDLRLLSSELSEGCDAGTESESCVDTTFSLQLRDRIEQEPLQFHKFRYQIESLSGISIKSGEATSSVTGELILSFRLTEDEFFLRETKQLLVKLFSEDYGLMRVLLDVELFDRDTPIRAIALLESEEVLPAEKSPQPLAELTEIEGRVLSRDDIDLFQQIVTVEFSLRIVEKNSQVPLRNRDIKAEVSNRLSGAQFVFNNKTDSEGYLDLSIDIPYKKIDHDYLQRVDLRITIHNDRYISPERHSLILNLNPTNRNILEFSTPSSQMNHEHPEWVSKAVIPQSKIPQRLVAEKLRIVELSQSERVKLDTDLNLHMFRKFRLSFQLLATRVANNVQNLEPIRNVSTKVRLQVAHAVFEGSSTPRIIESLSEQELEVQSLPDGTLSFSVEIDSPQVELAESDLWLFLDVHVPEHKQLTPLTYAVSSSGTRSLELESYPRPIFSGHSFFLSAENLDDWNRAGEWNNSAEFQKTRVLLVQALNYKDADLLAMSNNRWASIYRSIEAFDQSLSNSNRMLVFKGFEVDEVLDYSIENSSRGSWGFQLQFAGRKCLLFAFLVGKNITKKKFCEDQTTEMESELNYEFNETGRLVRAIDKLDFTPLDIRNPKNPFSFPGYITESVADISF